MRKKKKKLIDSEGFKREQKKFFQEKEGFGAAVKFFYKIVGS